MRGIRVHELLPVMHDLVPVSCHGYVLYFCFASLYRFRLLFAAR
jgi:hypothetical protein